MDFQDFQRLTPNMKKDYLRKLAGETDPGQVAGADDDVVKPNASRDLGFNGKLVMGRFFGDTRIILLQFRYRKRRIWR